jgi:hypothetical protein
MWCPVQFSVRNINNIDRDFSIVTTVKKQTVVSKEASLFCFFKFFFSLVTKATFLMNATDITLANNLSNVCMLQFYVS